MHMMQTGRRGVKHEKRERKSDDELCKEAVKSVAASCKLAACTH
jgi:hypothetical protein